MAELPRLHYRKTWEDPADYPAYEPSEAQVRADMQSLFEEIRAYLNDTLLPLLEQGTITASGGGSGVPDNVLLKSGGQMTGPLLLAREPVESGEAVTKTYADSAAGQVAQNLNGDLSALRVQAGQIDATVRGHTDNISQITQRASLIEGLVQDNQGGISSLRQSSAELRAYVQNELSQSLLQTLANQITLSVTREGASARIRLLVGEHASEGSILLDGNVDISGELSADALYAAGGEVAELAVDRLSTSRRIVKYLRRDQSDDTFIRIRNQRIEFVAGICQPEQTVQAQSPVSGKSLWWTRDTASASLGDDGYPRLDGERIPTTTVETNWPVYVYRYTEQVKRTICFEQNPLNGIYEPVDIYGAGNEQGYNIARVYKGTEGFDLRYVTPDGRAVGFQCTTDGCVDFYGARRTQALDFSGWNSGHFSETVAGTEQEIQYGVSFDAQNRPVRITGGGGELEIVW